MESPRSSCECVCMNWTICSTVFVDVHVLQTVCEKLRTFLLPGAAAHCCLV